MSDPLSSKQQDDYNKLRMLILGELGDAKIKQLTDNDIAYIANLISEALTTRSHKDDSLNHALAPVIDGAFERAISHNPGKIADIFYPIIGPAIRKSVSSALFDMVQSLNQLLEQSLSFKSLLWRFKAWRSGKNYAEYLLLRTLKYRVEQVFLIHRETGILINSAVASEVVTQDPDLVSSMLTAINDFVADSFSANNESLEWLKFGELTLQIVVGPKAIIATATRGSAGQYITQKVTQVLEEIHNAYYSKLNEYDGEQWTFVEPLLENCLISRLHKPEKAKKPWLALLLIIASSSYLFYQFYLNHQITQQQNNIINLINNDSEYFLLSQHLNKKTLEITLARDYQTQAFSTKLKQQEQNSEYIKINEISLPFNLNQYLLPYIHTLTQSPETLLLNSKGNILELSGEATRQQVDRIINNTLLKKNFQSVDDSDITIIQTSERSPLVLKQEAQKKLHNEINGQWFAFETNAVQLSSNELNKFNVTLKNLKKLYSLSQDLNRPIKQITLMGFADNSGTLSSNKKLSLRRAVSLKELLVINGIPEELIIVNGSGNNKDSLLNNNLQRRVTMMIYY